ncbi:MAG TPA: hypothetical protein PK961_03875 [bacterium]|nr:hypothetical protein [bacterium]
MQKQKWLGFFTAFVVLLSLPLACGDDDDNNDDNDDAADDDDSADDDSSPDDDDDTSPDDDDDVDDDNDDDDTGDDDDTSTELMVFGSTDAGERFSLRLTADGWVRQDFPQTRILDDGFMGPSFFLNGETGWATVNYVDSVFGNTSGYDLLTYDRQTGWSVDSAHPAPDADANIAALFATQADTLWISVVSLGHMAFDPSLWSYGGGDPVRHLADSDASWIMEFNRPDNGYFYGVGWTSIGQLAHWNGTQAQTMDMPTGYENGLFWRLFLLTDDEGFLCWADTTWEDAELVHMHDGQFEAVATPAGCADPGALDHFVNVGSALPDAGYIILPASRPSQSDVFWEYRDGQWSCREPETTIYAASTLVLRDGRVFVLGWKDNGTALYEVFADRLEAIELPAVNFTPTCLQAVGPQAPQYHLCFALEG